MAEASAPSLPSPGRQDAAGRRNPGLVDSVWALFASPRLTVPLLAWLVLACALGALVNRDHRPLSELVAAFGDRWWVPLYEAFELNDVFRSWWLLLLLVLLALNLIAHTLDRLPRIAAVALHPDKLVSERLLRAVALQRGLQLADTDPQKAAERVTSVFQTHGFFPETLAGPTAPGGDPTAVYLFAERGRWSRFGPSVVQAGLLLGLAGAAVSAIGGIEGTIEAPADHATFDFVFRHTASGSSYREPLGFTVRVDDFRLKTYPNGHVRSFETDLAVVANAGGPRQRDLMRKTVREGDPLVYGDWTLQQAGYEEAPGRDRVKLHVLDKTSGTTQDVVLQKDGEVKVSDKLGDVTFKALNYTQDLAKLGPAVQLTRTEGDRATSFWVLQNYPDFDTDDRGDRVGLRFDGLAPSHLTRLRATTEPGAPLWLGGGCLAVLGLGLALYSSHRRLWAKVEPGGKVTLAGAAHRFRGAFEERFGEVAAELVAPASPAAKDTPKGNPA